jgi:cobyrinic acid a,c-diamide synthase
MLSENYPRIVISGLSGDSGKTVVSCGLLACLKERGTNVYAFKKGPDYIDAAWLSLSSGKPARNLDTYLMGFDIVKNSFIKNAKSGINIIEGNRGLFDGADSKGTHSTAELAKLLQAPVIIVQDVSKVTRTAAASILGCQKLDLDLKIAGVILNKVAGERHAKIAKEAIEELTGIPVLGSIPKLSGNYSLPSRHLGLITPGEYDAGSVFINNFKKVIEENVDVDKIIEIVQTSPQLKIEKPEFIKRKFDSSKTKVKIGYFRDKSFSFYYPENLEMLADAESELIEISSTQNAGLGELDALYIGGGFPETNLEELSSNKGMMNSLKNLVDNGLPIYAECGGLMYLAKSVSWQGKEYLLSDILPMKVIVEKKPQGHGYSELIVDGENPFFETGKVIRGHEFHYSRIYEYDQSLKTTFSVSRGTGSFNKRDGLTHKNVCASYFHVHALATPEWVEGMIKSARKYKELKKTTRLVGIN